MLDSVCEVLIFFKEEFYGEMLWTYVIFHSLSNFYPVDLVNIDISCLMIAKW